MVDFAIALGVVAGIAVPHVLPLHRVPPAWASAVWFAALALRALVGVAVISALVLYLPRTHAFATITRWCWHAVLPVLAAHLRFSGHRLADAGIVLPIVALGASIAWMAMRAVVAGVAIRLRLARRTLGAGPLGSTIVVDDDVLVAVTSVGRARLLVSDAALRVMDRAELAASLAHEIGHVRRRHRWVLCAAGILGALGRCLPGTTAARRQLAFHLERDADDYAVRVTNDPLALASAICKAAGGGRAVGAVTPLAGRGGVTIRLDQLLDRNHDDARGGGALLHCARLLACSLAMMTVLLAVSLPTWAIAASGTVPGALPAAVCPT